MLRNLTIIKRQVPQVGFNLRNTHNRPSLKSRSDDTTLSLLVEGWDKIRVVPAGLTGKRFPQNQP